MGEWFLGFSDSFWPWRSSYTDLHIYPYLGVPPYCDGDHILLTRLFFHLFVFLEIIRHWRWQICIKRYSLDGEIIVNTLMGAGFRVLNIAALNSVHFVFWGDNIISCGDGGVVSRFLWLILTMTKFIYRSAYLSISGSPSILWRWPHYQGSPLRPWPQKIAVFRG